jgi:V/A-type H+/Na+-transporting ATPase subunit K
MYWLIGFMSLTVIGLIAAGLTYELSPRLRSGGYRPWFKPTLATSLLVFVISEIVLLLLGGQEALAAVDTSHVTAENVSTGMGLDIIGVGIPTAFSTLGAGLAVGPIGAASLAVLAEKPEMFGRTLIYLGLAEGIAIYGLVVSILLLGKL